MTGFTKAKAEELIGQKLDAREAILLELIDQKVLAEVNRQMEGIEGRMETKMKEKIDALDAEWTQKFDQKVKEEAEILWKKFKKEFDEELEREQKVAEAQLSKEWGKHQNGQNDNIKDLLHVIIDGKPEPIAKVVLDLKKTCGYLTKDTTELKKEIEGVDIKTKSLDIDIKKVDQRTDDQEDRSRRYNMVFFNIPEEEHYESARDCAVKVREIIKPVVKEKAGNRQIPFDRAHRIGKKDPKGIKVRPMVVKFTFYQDKELVMKEGRDPEVQKFRGKKIGISEDFCKETLNVRRKLVNYMKDAKIKTKDDSTPIKGGHVNYRTLTLIYEGPDEKRIYKYITLSDIEEYPFSWYKLSE